MSSLKTESSLARPWYKLEVAKHLAFIMGMDDKGVAAHFRGMLMALAQGKTGANPLADDMMNESDRYANRQRMAGYRGAAARYGVVPDGAPPGLKKEIEKSLGAKPKRKVKAPTTDDPYSELASCDDEDLPELTLEFCGDADRKKALGSYKKFMREVGPEQYRAALNTFVGAIRAGEDCANRGAAFTKNYLKPMMNK